MLYWCRICNSKYLLIDHHYKTSIRNLWNSRKKSRDSNAPIIFLKNISGFRNLPSRIKFLLIHGLEREKFLQHNCRIDMLQENWSHWLMKAKTGLWFPRRNLVNTQFFKFPENTSQEIRTTCASRYEVMYDILADKQNHTKYFFHGCWFQNRLFHVREAHVLRKRHRC